MSKAAYVASLRRRLRKFEARVKADERQLTTGSPQEKVAAAGDLAVVERRIAATNAKLSRLEAEPEGAWANFKTEIEQEFDDLEAAFDRWAEGKG